MSGGRAETVAVLPPLRHPVWLVVASSLWMATLGNLPLWLELSRLQLLRGAGGLAFGAGLVLMITALLMALQSLLAWRWTLKAGAIALLLTTAVGAHFMLAYRIVIDPTMMVNVVQTDVREAGDLLNLRLLVTVALLGGLPALAVWRLRLDYGGWPRRLGHNLLLLLAGSALFVGLLLASFQTFSSAMRNHKQLRYLVNPLNTVFAGAHLATKPLRRDDSVLLPLGRDVRPGPMLAAAGRPPPPLLVLVLGETARAANFGLNGYGRDTTPALARLGVVSFRNAWSCGTSTATSVPCMFSHLGRDGFEARKTNFENLLDVLQQAGLAVLWLDNQSGCKGVCDRVPHVSTAAGQDPSLCPGGECFDEIMLQGLDERLAALPAERRARGVVVVMHQMGSHGPAYYKRSPPAFKRFLPECDSIALQDCSRERLLNAYDNSIAYTDHFLAATIAWLQAHQDRAAPALLYVSDHGESLGENNLFLHGLPYAVAPDVQKHVPWISWLSPAFEQRRGLRADCLRQRLDARLSHDHFFHSVLGLLDLRTAVYQPALDAYAPCRQDPA